MKEKMELEPTWLFFLENYFLPCFFPLRMVGNGWAGWKAGRVGGEGAGHGGQEVLRMCWRIEEEKEKKMVELQPQKEAEVPEGGQKSGASNASFSALAVIYVSCNVSNHSLPPLFQILLLRRRGSVSLPLLLEVYQVPKQRKRINSSRSYSLML